jgi:Holliday junction resolvasome RuvABC ATP-dependent DNA helicase subunit
VDPDFDDLDPIKALKELKQYGRVAEEMEELGVMVEQIRRSLKGLMNHYVFTSAPGTGKTSVA